MGLLLAFLMAFTLAGCGGSSDEDVAKDVQANIEKAGWEIKHVPDSGTAVNDLNLIIDNKDHVEYKFTLSLSKEEKMVNFVSHIEASSILTESLGYNTKDEKDDSLIYYSGDKNCVFNPETNEVNASVSTSTNCDETAPKFLKTMQEARDAAL